MTVPKKLGTRACSGIWDGDPADRRCTRQSPRAVTPHSSECNYAAVPPAVRTGKHPSCGLHAVGCTSNRLHPVRLISDVPIHAFCATNLPTCNACPTCTFTGRHYIIRIGVTLIAAVKRALRMYSLLLHCTVDEYRPDRTQNLIPQQYTAAGSIGPLRS